MRFHWGLHEENGRWTGGKVMDLRDGLTQGVIAKADPKVTGHTLTLHAHLDLRAFRQARTRPRANAASRQTHPQATEHLCTPSRLPNPQSALPCRRSAHPAAP